MQLKESLLFALLAIVLWSFLAYLGASLSHLPPFLIVGISLTFSGLLSSTRYRSYSLPLKTFAVGVGGIFGYHFFFFSALQFAPAVEANLINYLWPLLIVLLSPVYLSGFNLKKHHIGGGVLGLVGAALIVTGGKLDINMSYGLGYLFAALAALTWSSYSLLTKKLPPFPTSAVAAFCLISGLLSLAVFTLDADLVSVIIDLTGRDWLLLSLLGAGPMGAAFFAWDAAMKHGDPRIVGGLAYLTPLLSTLILVVLGGKNLALTTGLAALLIVAGAALGAKDIFR